MSFYNFTFSQIPISGLSVISDHFRFLRNFQFCIYILADVEIQRDSLNQSRELNRKGQEKLDVFIVSTSAMCLRARHREFVSRILRKEYYLFASKGELFEGSRKKDKGGSERSWNRLDLIMKITLEINPISHF